MKSPRTFFIGLCLLVIHQLAMLHVSSAMSQREVLDIMKQHGDILCPGLDICGSNPNATVSTQNCCAACSCDEQCHIHGRCCFPSSTSAPSVGQFKTCEYTTTDTGRRTRRLPKLMLNMISKCPSEQYTKHTGDVFDSTTTKSIEPTTDCGEIPVVPWGGLLPVYSETTKAIYKNKYCAACHGVTDATPDPFIIQLGCTDITIDTYMMALLDGGMPHDCHINVNVDKEFINTIIPHRCYLNTINECEHSDDFAVRNDITMNATQVSDACASGFFSPVMSVKYYYPFANIFCFICKFTNALDHLIDYCLDGIKAVDERIPFQALTVVLRFDVFSSNQQREPVIKCISANWTHSSKQDVECRPVLCPAGQQEDLQTGQCVYIIKDVDVHMYRLSLIYLPEEILSHIDFFAFINTTNIAMHMEKPWELNQVYFSFIGDSENIVLFVTVSCSRPVENYDVIVQKAHTLATTPMTLKANETREIRMLPQMSRQRLGCLRHKSAPGVWFNYKGLGPKELVFQYIYDIGDMFTHVAVDITRLNLCRQIALNEEEYILSENECELFVKMLNRTLLSADFVADVGHTQRPRVRICVDDIAGNDYIEEKARSSAVVYQEATVRVAALILPFITFVI